MRFEEANDALGRVWQRAHVVPIDNADSFFSKVGELVAAIESFSQPHPLSVDAAVASLKKYLSVRHKLMYRAR